MGGRWFIVNKLEILQHYFGHQSFREQQEEVIDAILDHRDVLMIMPTGGGKSLCYQLPSLIMRGVTIVISPLLALMHDQVVALRENGISSAMLSSMQSIKETKEIENALYKNRIKLLYVAPERLMNEYFLSFLMDLDINFFVVDEAHCVSEWGHEFREHYRMLSQLKISFPSVAISAFTATATTLVREDIISTLQLQNPKIVIGSIFRSNLIINAKHRQGDGKRELINFLREREGVAGIIYILSRKQTESLATFLKDKGYRAEAFHAQLPNETKRKVYNDFISDDIDIVVATIAFGMGIDKSNIRFVVHMSMPKTIENYYQEIGRAGRDGLEATATLFFSAQDIIQQKSFIDDLPDTLYKKNAYDKLNSMVRFAKSESCRHQQIANYFNDFIEPCKNRCDNCINPPKDIIDITEASQKLLSTIYRTKQSFGIHYIVDILRGSKDKRVIKNGHDSLSVYGVGKEYSKSQWLSIADRLLELGAVRIGDYKVYYITQRGVSILKGKENVDIREDRVTIKKIQKRKRVDYFDDYEVEIFDRLRELRKEIAIRNKIPPYVVFSDKTLKELSIILPTDKLSMLQVHGIGEIKFQRYGKEFLRLIRKVKGSV
jgi:ATP-dependent DNA helicase RecQ